ncbi:hypothetical protein A3F65_03340 [Candidatus Saccharibacteria bacterium RIFCSPHIGHO2_12_FULL_47_16b]|nr:MAG: hypothetical protein A3F65_03340 [Candidatus Saccharibacteria bacterium RIFCSPHIGHO2_12_FULL_47_16b]OGL40030.1 MAG: hypothetical protein A3J32_03620 [Candidatus Saccharibacteria bacterium RIFCSPLOWO2_02_FULL_46_7]
MSSSRMRLVLIATLALVSIVFLAIVFGGLNIIGQQSKKMVNLKLESHTANAQLTSLASAKKQVEQYAYFNDVAKTVVPSDKNQAQAVLDIYQMANESGINLQTVTFPASSLGSTAKKTDTDAKAVEAATAISQATPVEGIKGLYSLSLTITPQTDPETPADKRVTYGKFLDFLKRVETNRRTAQITSVNVTPTSSQFGFIITVNIFIKP